MATKPKYKPTEVIEAIKASKHGFETEVADLLLCSPRTVRNYINKYEEVKDAYIDRRERLIDHVESRLHSEIDKGNVTAIIFYLKTQAKDRGYVERQELTGADGSKLAIHLSWEEDNE